MFKLFFYVFLIFQLLCALMQNKMCIDHAQSFVLFAKPVIKRFCLPKKTLFLTENIKLNVLRTKIKWKIHTCFAVYQFLKVLLIKKYTATSFFISSFTSADIIIFYKLLELSSTLSEKNFHHKFSYVHRFTLTIPHPLNNQNPLSLIKVFCWCSLSSTYFYCNIMNILFLA